MKDPKVIFFDIDGTLVSFETHQIPESTVWALDQLREKGVKLIISTGRALRDINNLGTQQFDGYVTANGAYCVNEKKEMIKLNLISKESLSRFSDYQKEHPFACIFMTTAGNFVNYFDDKLRALLDQINLPIPTEKPLEEILQNEIFQIDAFVDEQEEQYLYKHVLTDCEGSRWHPNFTDITLRGSNKATGVQTLLDYYGLTKEQAIAFGDGGNDVSMLRYVGMGVAMGNAADDVKAEANYVTTTIDDDGILNALKHFGVL